MTRSVDLNADVGESYGRWVLGDDHHLLPHLSSANVACGFHAGDPTTLRRTVGRAAELGVRVGAQVGYPDLRGFGRRAIDVAPEDLEADVLYQVGALAGLCRAAGTRVSYLKPHGALYHRTLDDPAQADAVVAACAAFGGMPVMTMADGQLARSARAAGLAVIAECFADRAYDEQGRLVPRSRPDAVLSSPDDVVAQAIRLAGADGCDSLCLHGDTPGAADLARLVRAGLEGAGFTVRSGDADA